MQEDKNLKELLTKYSVENTSTHFTSGVMQRITSAYAFNQPAQPLLKQRIPRILVVMFVIVCVVLVALSLTAPVAVLPTTFTVKLPAKYISQSFQFIIVFWLVMFFNLLLTKYRFKAM